MATILEFIEHANILSSFVLDSPQGLFPGVKTPRRVICAPTGLINASEPAAVIDIIPLAVAPEIGNEIAKLELLSRAFSIGARVRRLVNQQLDYARRFHVGSSGSSK